MNIQALKPFIYQDQAYQTGERVQVTESAGKWLIAQGVAVEEIQPIPTQNRAKAAEKTEAQKSN